MKERSIQPTKPLLLDGGMGRELWHRGVEVPATIWSANGLIAAPDVVRDIHRDYITSGADVMTTNTYSVVRGALASEGIEDRFEELTTLACQLATDARNAASRNVLIAGSLPPLQESYRPDLVGELDAMLPLYSEQVSLMAPWVDVFLCETMSSIAESLAAATAARETGKPVWVSWTLDDHNPTRLKSGEPIADAVKSLAHLNIAAILFNCCMPETITAAMPLLVETSMPGIGGYANTFTPPPPDWTLEEEGVLGLRDDLDPASYAGFASDWLDAGASIIGGCCGTRPAHIATLHQLLVDRGQRSA